MKNKLITIITAGMMLVLTQVSHAYVCGPNDYMMPCCYSNWYLAASGSVVWHNDLKLRCEDINNSIGYKTGWGLAASVGYIFDLCCDWDIRIEEELLYRRNKLKNDTFTSADGSFTFPIHGHNQDWALMTNFILDMPVMCDLTFYLGGGIGVDFNRMTVGGGHGGRSNTLFGWQFLTGFSWCLCPNTEFTVGYRLFGTTRNDHHRNRAHFCHTPITQSLDLGIRFRL